MIANRRLHEDLEEIDISYQELISVAKEALRMNMVIEQQYEEIVEKNKDLHKQKQAMETEKYRLKKISQALDGLTILAKAARKL